MRKTGSTGNLFNIDQYSSSKTSLRPVTTMRRHKNRKLSNYLPYNLNNLDMDSYNSVNNYNYDHISLNKTSKQLYDGLMCLKKKVNFLNEEISLAKSEQRKKDVQLSLKNKEIEEYLSDIKMSKDLNPVNVNKLKENNIITKLKKEYNNLKNTLDELKSKIKILEIKLKKSRPNKVKQFNLSLEKRLKILIMEYNILHQDNDKMNNQLDEMKNLPKIFTENHKIIERLKNRIDEQEKKVNELKNEINEVNNKKNLNEVVLDRQKIKNINLNQKNQYLENEIENRKKIAKMKVEYENKIKKLTEKKDELEEKIRNQERTISTIKREMKLSEEKRKMDPLKLKAFNYTAISKVEKNPQDGVDSKFILLQSLLDESLNKKRRYQESIQEFIERFKELGYDYTELDKIIEEGKDKDIKEENEKDKDKKEENNKNNISDDKKENDEININDINLDNENNNKNIINENEEKNENKVEMDINQEDLNNNTNNDNNKSKNNEEQNEYEKEFNEMNNNNNNENNNINKEEKKENNTLQKSNKDLKNSQEMNKGVNNKLIKENINKSLPENNTPISSDEFSELTFILVKSFEAKKINEELARQKIIIIPTREQMEKNTFIDQMCFNIMKAIHCENKDSSEKIKNWLSSFLTMCDDDQKKMTESFLSLFKEVNIYNSEKELFFSKKIKKYLFKKNADFPKKIEQYKNKYISFQLMKKILEENNIELKDEYSQYLFYELKRFEDPQASISDLKIENLFKIFENTQGDSKMEEESDIEISNDQYVNIIYNLGIQIIKYVDENKTTLRKLLGDKIKDISGENVPEKDRVEIVVIEDFIEKMKEIGILISTEIEIYCIFSRYKISDDYGIISLNLLEKDLENFRESKNEEENNKNVNEDINQINNLERIGVPVETPEKNNLKVMEKVQEENEDNASNSDNK